MARRHDIDWLRVGATYLLFVFHVAMVFNPAPFYHVRNAELSVGMLVLAGFISLWHMPLFFVLSGWSAAGALRARGSAGFARERVQRLLVPLLAGSALLGPPVKYLELRSGLDANHTGLYVSPALQEGFRQVLPGGLPVMAPFGEGFFEFLPSFYTVSTRFTWAHLWFLAYLFTFSLLYLPLLSWLARRPSRLRPLGAVWAYAPVLPLAVFQVWLRPRWPGLQNLYDDWANFTTYSTYLIAGFLVARHPALEEAVHREWKRALAIALAAMLLLLLSVLGVPVPQAPMLAATAVAGWCFLVALLGFGRRYLTASGAALDYLAESTLPVYILHQAAIVVPGYWIVQLPLGIAAKFSLLLFASVLLTMATYHLVVRRFAVARFLFGMKRRPSSRAAWVASPRAVATLLAVAVSAGLLAADGAPPACAGTPRSSAATAAAGTAAGLWYAEGGAAQVEIAPCDDGLCGRVVWLRSPLDERGCELRDERNPDARLRDRGVVGLEVLRGLTPGADAGVWEAGTIYDPASGRTYRCSASLDGADRLRLRGYVGIPLLGRTTTWIRVGSERRLCAAASG